MRQATAIPDPCLTGKGLFGRGPPGRLLILHLLLLFQDIGLAPEGAGEGAHLVGDNDIGRRRSDPFRGLRLLANCLGHFHGGTNRVAAVWFRMQAGIFPS